MEDEHELPRSHPALKGLFGFSLLSILSACIAPLYFAPKFQQVFEDILGGGGALPGLTVLILNTYRALPLFGVLLAVLAMGIAMANRKKENASATLVVLTALLLIFAIGLAALFIIGLYLPLTTILVELSA